MSEEEMLATLKAIDESGRRIADERDRLREALEQVPRTVERLLTESGNLDALHDMLDEITAEVHQALELAKGEKT